MVESRFIKVRRGVVALVALVAVLLALTPFGRRLGGTIAAPFAALGHRVGGLVRWLMPGAPSEEDELGKLKGEVVALQAQLAEVAELREENARLRREAALEPHSGWRGIVAEIVARDPERWEEKLRINRGSADGVKEGAVVLVGGEVLGRVFRCERHSAEVVTVVAPECRFGAKLEGSDAVGVLTGGDGGFKVDYLPRDLAVKEGQTILTSDKGGGMPAGLPVGRIVPDPNDGRLFHTIASSRCMVRGVPYVPFAHSRFVTVLVPDPSR